MAFLSWVRVRFLTLHYFLGEAHRARHPHVEPPPHAFLSVSVSVFISVSVAVSASVSVSVSDVSVSDPRGLVASLDDKGRPRDEEARARRGVEVVK